MQSSIGQHLSRATLLGLALFALAGGVAWLAQQQAARSLEWLIDVAESMRVQALEMEIKLAKAGVATLGYLRSGERVFLVEFEDAVRDHAGHHTKFVALAAQARQQAPAQALASAFERYQGIARGLIEGKDDHRRKLAAWRSRLEAVEPLLEAVLEAAPARHIESLLVGMAGGVQSHLHGDALEHPAHYRQGPSRALGAVSATSNARAWADRSRADVHAVLQPLDAMAAERVALGAAQSAAGTELLARQREFDRILDDQIQAPIEQLVALARERAQRWSMAASATLVVALLLAAIGGLLTMRRTIGRIRSGVAQLDAAVAAVARGDWSYRVPAPGADELGRLGAAFNQMTVQVEHAQAALAGSNADLEHVVAQRTALLDEANAALTRANLQLRTGHERLNVAAVVFENASDAIIVSDSDGAVVAVNPAFTAMTGHAAGTVHGRAAASLQGEVAGPDGDSLFHASIGASPGEHEPWQGERLVRRADGQTFPAWLKVAAVRNDCGATLCTVSTLSQLGPLKAAEARLRRLADHDPLTGLPGRRLLFETLAGELQRASPRRRKLALLVLDVDRFSAVNEAWGHDTGDALLRLLASRTRACLEPGDRLFHLYGDTLAIVVDDLAHAADAIARATRLLQTLALRCTIGTHVIDSSVSIGIGAAPDDAADASGLIIAAQTALRRAKALGGHNAQFFTSALADESHRYVKNEAALRSAFAERRFALHYQPQLDCASGAVVGFEALARWPHPTQGLVSIGPYIDVAEGSGLIHSIGEWALLEACHEAVRWPLVAGHALRVSVNVSALQVARGGLVDQVRNALRASGLPAQRLELELTESSLQSGARIAATLRELKGLGVGLALDDFGIGYSSLASLKHLPVDRLKIDRSFVADLLTDAGDAGIVQTIVAIARGLGRRVIAEGVEDLRQLDWLRQQGCDEFQGFLASAAVPGERVAELLGSSHTRARARTLDAIC